MALKESSGFTIIEIMIAMAVFSIGILGVIKMQYMATMQNSRSRMNTEASAVVASYIEDMLNVDYSDIGDISSDKEEAKFSLSSGVACNISRVVASDVPIKDVKQVKITIEWQPNGLDSSQKPKFEVIYYIKNPGMST